MSAKNKNPYKDTLNLPQTDFDMRAGLLKKEPLIQQQWTEQDLYGQIRRARRGAEPFVLHDGPPYANGDIHMGHTLNKVLKDMVIRIQTMAGKDAPYVPGWDCHGLPIEQKVLDAAGDELAHLDAMEIRRRCHAYADKYLKLQAQQFRRLGVMGDFEHPYVTMDTRYEADVLEVFAQLLEQGLVHRQLKPVHWSMANQTALADAELIYRERTDPSIYVLFRLAGGAEESNSPLGGQAGEPLHVMIWTTTPWTLPGNRAVAVHPDYRYAVVALETAAGVYRAILADQRVEPVLSGIQAKRSDWLLSYQVEQYVSGRELIDARCEYVHPLDAERTCPVVGAPYVTLEDGTGLVHTAPGHGLEDYHTGLREGLEVACPVGPDGRFDDSAPGFLQGLDVWEGNKKVVAWLDEQGSLALDEPFTHSYPHDWRSKTPTIFRATEQWFVAVDKPLAKGQQTLRQHAMETAGRPADDDGIDFYPAWGRNRMLGMLQTRPDWCISRQRAWGLPIPAFYNPAGKVLLTPASVRAVAKVFAEQGSDAWFNLSPAELLRGYDPAGDADLENADAFDVNELTGGQDIFDVWFESGSSFQAVALRRELVKELPVDLYLEGSDQHRGWFQLSLLPALGAKGTTPFRSVLTHGFVVDERGYKMSKSEGNTVNVIQQLESRGADILRLWVAWQNYQDDVRCSENLIAQAEDAYRKIRNTLRFCMGSCADFDPAAHAADPAPHSVDNWMQMQLHILVRDVREAFEQYEFHRATRAIYEFCAVQASSVYLSAVKDRLYCELPDAPRRRATQTVIHRMLTTLVKLLAPILPHTAEEAWAHIPARAAEEPDSVHLAGLPEYDADVLRFAEDIRPVNVDQADFSSDTLAEGPWWVWAHLMDLRGEGLVKLEALRNSGVKNSLEAEAVLKVRQGDASAKAFAEAYLGEIEDLLGVGYARIEEVDQLPGGGESTAAGLPMTIEVLDTREKYPRCERSWKRRPDVGDDPEHPQLSVRDAGVVRALQQRS